MPHACFPYINPLSMKSFATRTYACLCLTSAASRSGISVTAESGQQSEVRCLCSPQYLKNSIFLVSAQDEVVVSHDLEWIEREKFIDLAKTIILRHRIERGRH